MSLLYVNWHFLKFAAKILLFFEMRKAFVKNFIFICICNYFFVILHAKLD